jgi:hypothetical protein
MGEEGREREGIPKCMYSLQIPIQNFPSPHKFQPFMIFKIFNFFDGSPDLN